MTRIGLDGYLTRNKRKGAYRSRDWYLVHYGGNKMKYPCVQIGTLYLSEELIGKRIRVKVSVEEKE